MASIQAIAATEAIFKVYQDDWAVSSAHEEPQKKHIAHILDEHFFPHDKATEARLQSIDDDLKERMLWIWQQADEFHNGGLTGKQASSEIRGVVEPLVVLKHTVQCLLDDWSGDGETQASVNDHIEHIQQAMEWDNA